MKKNPNFHDVEQLSALLDGKLSQADSARLEARLRAEPELRRIHEDLTETRSLLRRLPARRAPRNFTLTPKMAGVKPPLPRIVPSLRFATALATFLLVFSMATNALAPAVQQASQAAPLYGMGGGGGGGAEEGVAPEAAPEIMSAPATEAPLEQTPPDAFAPAATLEPTLSAQDNARIAETPTPEAVLKNPAPEQPATAPQAAPLIPIAWELGLLLVAVVFGAGAWLIRSASERAWRARKK